MMIRFSSSVLRRRRCIQFDLLLPRCCCCCRCCSFLLTRFHHRVKEEKQSLERDGRLAGPCCVARFASIHCYYAVVPTGSHYIHCSSSLSTPSPASTEFSRIHVVVTHTEVEHARISLRRAYFFSKNKIRRSYDTYRLSTNVGVSV